MRISEGLFVNVETYAIVFEEQLDHSSLVPKSGLFSDSKNIQSANRRKVPRRFRAQR
jgi:hypothetical protein